MQLLRSLVPGVFRRRLLSKCTFRQPGTRPSLKHAGLDQYSVRLQNETMENFPHAVVNVFFLCGFSNGRLCKGPFDQPHEAQTVFASFRRSLIQELASQFEMNGVHCCRHSRRPNSCLLQPCCMGHRSRCLKLEKGFWYMFLGSLC